MKMYYMKKEIKNKGLKLLLSIVGIPMSIVIKILLITFILALIPAAAIFSVYRVLSKITPTWGNKGRKSPGGKDNDTSSSTKEKPRSMEDISQMVNKLKEQVKKDEQTHKT